MKDNETQAVECRRKRALAVLVAVEASLDEMDLQYKRLQRMLAIRYTSALILVTIGSWWLWMYE